MRKGNVFLASRVMKPHPWLSSYSGSWDHDLPLSFLNGWIAEGYVMTFHPPSSMVGKPGVCQDLASGFLNGWEARDMLGPYTWLPKLLVN